MSKSYLIIVGAAKCGTSAMAAWLGSQPDAVLARQKETLYFTDFAKRCWAGPDAGFAENIPPDAEGFEAEFAADPEASLRIEASTDNMSCPAAAENIARFAEREDVKDVRLMAILRDPVARIVSEFEHTLRLGWQSGSLLQSLEAERARISDGWHPLFWHVARSRYASQLARYRELFGEKLLIVDFHRIGDPDERSRVLRWTGLSEDAAETPLPRENERKVLARPGVVGLLNNRHLTSLGRALVPKTLRSPVRRMMTGPSVDRYQLSDAELDFMHQALADEIEACIESPDIQTDRWEAAVRARA